MTHTFRIRDADVADAHGIASVHVASWRVAYRGLMPDAVLDELSVNDRAAGWRRTLSTPDAVGRTIVADRAGAILGWASFGAGRDDGMADHGELWGLYAQPEAFSTGVGHALITAVEASLRDDGYATAYLWVLDGNDRAAGFYERHGWTADGGVKLDVRGRMTLRELCRRRSLVPGATR